MNKPSPQSPPQRSAPGSDSAAELALARANLLRLRRQWQEASAECLAILRADPGNVDAHVLLGDIQLDLGEPREAQHWYRLALTLAPDNESIREKLTQALERGPAPTGAHERGRIGQASGAANVGVPPPKRLATLGVLSLLGLALLVGTYYLGPANRESTPRPRSGVSGRARAESSRAGRPRPPTPAVGSPAAIPRKPKPKAETTPSRPTREAPTPSRHREQAPAPPRLTGAERRLLDTLRSALSLRKDGGYTIYGVTFDPTVGAVIVTFESPQASLSGAVRRQILARARGLAQLIASNLPKASILTLRAAVPRDQQLDLVFVGVTTRTALKHPNESPLFTPEWWAQK